MRIVLKDQFVRELNDKKKKSEIKYEEEQEKFNNFKERCANGEYKNIDMRNQMTKAYMDNIKNAETELKNAQKAIDDYELEELRPSQREFVKLKNGKTN